MNGIFIKYMRNILIGCRKIVVVFFICSMSSSRAMNVGIINSVAFVGNTRIVLAGSNGCKLYSIDKDDFSLYNEKPLCLDTVTDMSVSPDCKYLAYAMSHKVELYTIFSNDCVKKCYSQDVGEVCGGTIKNIACGKKFLFIFYKKNNSLYSYGLLSYEYDKKKSLDYDLSDLHFCADRPAMSCQLEGNMVLVQACDPCIFLIDVSDSNKFDKYEHIKNSFASDSNRALSGIFNHNDSIVAINSHYAGYVLYDTTHRDRAIATISHKKLGLYVSIALYQSGLAALLKNKGDAVEFWSYIEPKQPKCILKIKLSLPTISLPDKLKIALGLKLEQKINLFYRNLNVDNDGSKLLAFSPNKIRFAAAVMDQLFISNNPLKFFYSKQCKGQCIFSLLALSNFLQKFLIISNNDVKKLIVAKLIDLYQEDNASVTQKGDNSLVEQEEVRELMPIKIKKIDGGQVRSVFLFWFSIFLGCCFWINC